MNPSCVPGFVLVLHLHFCTEIPPSTTPQGCGRTFAVFWLSHSVGIPVILGTPTIEQTLEMEAEACFCYRSYRGGKKPAVLPPQAARTQHVTGLDQCNFLPGLCILGGSWAVTVYSPEQAGGPAGEVPWQQLQQQPAPAESSVSTLCSSRVTAATKLKDAAPLE